MTKSVAPSAPYPGDGLTSLMQLVGVGGGGESRAASGGAKSGAENANRKKKKSFLAENWMIILPVVLILIKLIG